MFVFLCVLEDSGIISRLAYVFDDILNWFGLNGKAIYTLLLGFGCNTMSTTTTRNLSDKNLKIKSSLINPYISCMARLPVFVLIASAFFELICHLFLIGKPALLLGNAPSSLTCFQIFSLLLCVLSADAHARTQWEVYYAECFCAVSSGYCLDP